MVLALELHGCHVGPGVGGHLMAPNDLCPPGACRQGGWPVRGGAGWGGGQAGGRQERQRWKEKTLEFAEWGAGLPKTWGLGWASCPSPSCDPRGAAVQGAGASWGVREGLWQAWVEYLGVLTWGLHGQCQGSGHRQQQAAPVPHPKPHGCHRQVCPWRAQWAAPLPTSRKGGTGLWPVVGGPTSNGRF